MANTKPKILAFAGSTREASFNKMLARQATEILKSHDAEVTFIDLRDYPMPLFDGDLEKEEGLPETALKFRELLKSHHGFLICAPEYNSSITAVLKNAIDWASRPRQGETNLECFIGKVVCLMSASPGKFGGIRGLIPLRSILSNIGSLVMPDQLCVPMANKAFENDKISDPETQKVFEKLCANFVKLVLRIKLSDNCIQAIQAER